MTDIFAGIPEVSSRAMFGGYGIYQAGVFFGLIAEDQLYFKVDDSNRAQYEQAKSQPFIYYKGKQPMTMQYWLVPEEVLENKAELITWMNQSVQIAKRSKRRVQPVRRQAKSKQS